MAITNTHNGTIELADPISVTDASTAIVALNTKRQYLTIYNADAANTVWLAFGVTAVAGKGTPLLAGVLYEIDTTNLTTVAISGICGTGLTASVIIQECQ